jgi:putative tryptophan/tyrosine transport system substrate-binding protein
LDLSSISKERAFHRAAVRQGLAELGFIEDRNVTIIYRYADGQYERLPELAAELVAQQVDLIVTGPSSRAAVASKRATSTIPIVFIMRVDPIGLGLVASYNEPSANATGINIAPNSLTAKRFEILVSLVPRSHPVAELINPTNKAIDLEQKVAAEAARGLGRDLVFVSASTEAEIATAFEEIARKRVGGLIIWNEAFFLNQREQIASLANRYCVATVYPGRLYARQAVFLAMVLTQSRTK